MAQLLLVRHGQASFFGADYDALSELGIDQARRLGELWAATGVRIGRVYVGPRRRHAQTCAEIERVYRTQGLAFPVADLLPGLDEHHGVAVAKAHLGETGPGSGTMPGVAAALATLPPAQAQAAALRSLHEVLRDWARGQIVVPGYETWEEFGVRVLGALDLMCAPPVDGLSVAFTSGGFVSAATGWVLGLDPDRVLDLHAVIRNASVTEIGYSGRRRRLIDFNSIPHLHAVELRTLI